MIEFDMKKCWTWSFVGENTSWYQYVRETPICFRVQIFHLIICVVLVQNGVVYWTQGEVQTRAYHLDQTSQNSDSDDKNVSTLLDVSEESALMPNSKTWLKQIFLKRYLKVKLIIKTDNIGYVHLSGFTVQSISIQNNEPKTMNFLVRYTKMTNIAASRNSMSIKH